eukprot:6211848-Pleurochrysis_carterae.AAC.2
MSACFPFRSGLFDGAVSVSAAHFLCETDGAGSSRGSVGTGSITGSDRCSGGGDSGTCNSITHVSGTCTSRRFDCATLSDGDGFSSSHTAQSSADGLDQSGREGAALSGGAGFGAGEDGNSSSERGGSRSSEHHLPERALFIPEVSSQSRPKSHRRVVLVYPYFRLDISRMLPACSSMHLHVLTLNCGEGIEEERREER